MHRAPHEIFLDRLKPIKRLSPHRARELISYFPFYWLQAHRTTVDAALKKKRHHSIQHFTLPMFPRHHAHLPLVAELPPEQEKHLRSCCFSGKLCPLWHHKGDPTSRWELSPPAKVLPPPGGSSPCICPLRQQDANVFSVFFFAEGCKQRAKCAFLWRFYKVTNRPPGRAGWKKNCDKKKAKFWLGPACLFVSAGSFFFLVLGACLQISASTSSLSVAAVNDKATHSLSGATLFKWHI